MCDYSLHGIKNRLAEEGETLVVHRFHTGSKGLTSLDYVRPTEEPKGLMATLKSMFSASSNECAICVPDGAKLVLTGISPALQQALSLCATETVTFRQLSAEAATHRDAVEFSNGVKLRLQDLKEGQRVRIVALSSEGTRVREKNFISVQARIDTQT